MSNNINVQGYLDTIKAPWGQLFYQMIWHHLEYKNKQILDFGSGFGLTADYLAEHNQVTAVEPNEVMLQYRFCNHPYHQLVGGLDELKKMPDKSFDIIICHNVFEYLDNRTEVLLEFKRLLKPEGFVSLVKHNRAGKIMQKAVFEYKTDEALSLLHNGEAVSVNFGTINEYENKDLETYIEGAFRIEKIYGVRMFFGLQRNEFKVEADWVSKMFELECAAEEVPAFRDIAFFHHIILKPVGEKSESRSEI